MSREEDLINKQDKLRRLKKEPILAIFDELEEINESLKSQKGADFTDTNKALKDILEKLPLNIEIPPAEKVDMSRTNELLSQMVSGLNDVKEEIKEIKATINKPMEIEITDEA